MKNDQEIYEELAKLLIPHAPAEASIIKYKMIIYPNESGGDYGYSQYFFNYVNVAGEEKCYMIDETSVVDKLSDLGLELRNSIAAVSGDRWSAMEFIIDMSKRRFEVNFDYNRRAPGEIA
jgi:hypothetical protein